MGSRAEKQGKVQVLGAGRGHDTQDLMPLLRQMILPMVAGMAQTKRTLQNLVVELGLASMQALFEAHAKALAGPKHRRQAGRTLNH
jgi:hypothetical protein